MVVIEKIFIFEPEADGLEAQFLRYRFYI